MRKSCLVLTSYNGLETTPSPLDVLWCLLFCTENSIVNSPERGAAMPADGFRETNNDESDANREITSH